MVAPRVLAASAPPRTKAANVLRYRIQRLHGDTKRACNPHGSAKQLSAGAFLASVWRAMLADHAPQAGPLNFETQQLEKCSNLRHYPSSIAPTTFQYQFAK